MKKLITVGLVMIFISCSTAREDIVFEAFTEPFLDWYSLKLYSNGEFDLHIPSVDYNGRYKLSGDTIFLRSGKNSQWRVATGNKTEENVTEEDWIFLIDSNRKKIRWINDGKSPVIWIDIVDNRLSVLGDRSLAF